MSDKIKERARRLQSELSTSYSNALHYAQLIRQASRTQLVWDEHTSPIDLGEPASVPEEDLLLLGLLGPSWTLQIFDMEQPYRYLHARLRISHVRHEQDIDVMLDYPAGNVSYTQSQSLSLSADGVGEQVHDMTTVEVAVGATPHVTAENIRQAFHQAAEQLGNCKLPDTLISNWGAPKHQGEF